MKLDEFLEFWNHSPRSQAADCNGRLFPAEVEEHGLNFSEIAQSVEGFGNPQMIAAINIILSRFMEPGETYCEVGTYCGRSLVGGLQNNDIVADVIDDYEYRGHTINLRKEFDKNIEKYGVADRVRVHSTDFRTFPKLDQTVGLYLFDGPHDYNDSYDGMLLCEPYFADQCLILVDDFARPPVQYDVQRWLNENPFSKIVGVFGFSEQQAMIAYRKQS